VLELGEAEYMVRTTGYLKSIDDFNQVVIAAQRRAGAALRRRQRAPGTGDRRGVAELNGQGEVAGGIIIMRSGKNALSTINAVKAKLAEVQKACPQAWRLFRSTIVRS
jgi:Cu(I)/Ag(I) efflux system membrane protein CusA/SilA